MRKYCGVFLVLAVVLALAGCAAATSSGGEEPTYTVSGTLTLEYQDAVGDVSVTATDGTGTYTASAPAPAVGGIQTLTYSVPGVPSGTYSVSLSYSTSTTINYAWYVLGNDGVQLLPASYGNDGVTTTMAIDGIAVSGNLQLDVTTGRAM